MCFNPNPNAIWTAFHALQLAARTRPTSAVPFGQKIRRLRQASKFDQQRLADCAGLSRTTVSKAENRVEPRSLESLRAIAAVLRINVAEIIVDVDSALGFAHFDLPAPGDDAWRFPLSKVRLERLVSHVMRDPEDGGGRLIDNLSLRPIAAPGAALAQIEAALDSVAHDRPPPVRTGLGAAFDIAAIDRHAANQK